MKRKDLHVFVVKVIRSETRILYLNFKDCEVIHVGKFRRSVLKPFTEIGYLYGFITEEFSFTVDWTPR